jgi:hypothetical protein
MVAPNWKYPNVPQLVTGQIHPVHPHCGTPHSDKAGAHFSQGQQQWLSNALCQAKEAS